MKDVRKEQLSLLRIEKQIAVLAAAMASGAGAAKAADGVLGSNEASKAYSEMQAALVNLAEVTSQTHAALNAQLVESGARLLEASGGVPKKAVSQVVTSILGIG